MTWSLQEMVGIKVKTQPWPWSCFSHVWFFATLWTITPQDPLPMGFSRQECWSVAMPSSREASPLGPGITASATWEAQKAGRGAKLWRTLKVRARSLDSMGKKTRKGLFLLHILGARNWAKIDLPYALNRLLTT